jgi:exopolyphosphatase / guanosine-5'-triphosphate,3'-diphosphate pyrophosphatase
MSATGHGAGAGSLAAIDCGTNSIRLLVTDRDGGALSRLMRITRLGEGTNATGHLSGEAMSRTLDVLSEYGSVMRRLGVARARAVATSAVRDAANGEEFLDAAEKACGVRPQLLTGSEEGRLAFAGAVAELDPECGPYLVVDIGGGSTELVLGPAPGQADREPLVVSLNVGCVRVTERFLLHDPPLQEELVGGVAAVEALVGEAASGLPLRAARTLVGLAGTVSALAAIQQGLREYDRARLHHFVLTLEATRAMFAQLAAEDSLARARRPGLEPARADVIVGGAIVLASVMEQLGFDRCLVSESDLLDGLVASMRVGGALDGTPDEEARRGQFDGLSSPWL